MAYKILIVSKSFYPVIAPRSFRATELAKELARQQHDVTVLTVKNPAVHDAFAREHNFAIKDLGRLTYRPVQLTGSGLQATARRGLRRILQLAVEYPDVELVSKVSRALKDEAGYDLLISIAVPYPVHWGVAKSLTDSHKPARVWVADCGDPYFGDTADSFRKPFYFKYVESWFLKKADFITIPLEEARSHYFEEFHEKIKVIPQGFNFSETVTEPYIRNAVPTFIYAGNFIPGYRDPGPFLEILSQIKKPFKFIIYTQSDMLVRPYAQRLGDKLEIKPFVDRPTLLQELSKADFLVNFSNSTTFQSPSKLIDYKLSGRPILTVDFNNANRNYLEQFLEGDYQNQHVINNIEDYDIKNVAKKFLSLIPVNQ